MKNIKQVIIKATGLFLIFTIICGMIYPFIVTGISQLAFREKANGSMIEVDGKSYGSELLGQQFTGDKYLWGRIMNIDTSTFTTKEGTKLMYAAPSNLSPASKEYQKLIQERVTRIKEKNPDAKVQEIPVDLVTCSGSGLDPHISVAAAMYQVPRIAEQNQMSQEEVKEMIGACTTGKVLGFIGEDVVNVLKVNLMLDGVLETK